MNINNKKKVVKLKRLFYLVSVVIALAALYLFLFNDMIFGLACVGVFSLWFLYFHVADYQFIEFSDENNRILLRYYKAVKLGKTEFSSIEFPQEVLKEAFFENTIFGKMSDLTLVIKTKRGAAEYPSVSLSGVSVMDRRRIKTALIEIIGK